jgi:hypothetical protein
MTTPFALLRLPILLLWVVSFIPFSALFAQTDTPTVDPTEAITSDKKTKDKRKDVSIAEKNANDLRKINLLLAIAQDRDRQAGETVEDIRSNRMRIEEDLTQLEDGPKNLSKKERAELESQLKSLQKKEKLAQKTRENANSFLLEVTQAVAAEPTKRAKFIAAYERKSGPINDSKAIEQTSDDLAATEKEQSKSLAVSEKNQTTESTPSVSTPIENENPTEKVADIAPSKSKKKKEPRAKQNESPKKVTEKAQKKKNKKTTTPDEVKTDESFPLVFNDNTPTPTPVETIEAVVEQPQTPLPTKKEPKKTSKKKAKKSETTAANTPKADDFPIVLGENNTPKVTPTTEPISDNAEATAVQETTPTNDAIAEDSDVKKGKKSKKNDKKPKKSTTTETAQGSLVSYKTYDRNVDVFMKSPAPECAIAYEGKDEFTGKNKRETAPARFFAHTDDIMRKSLQDKDFITCDLSGTKVESSRYTYLNMTFTILSKDIQRTLGFLDRGTPIIFVLVNGKKITMRTNKTDIGVVDIDKGITTYKAQLTAESITDMTESELDYVRVNWSSGYEDYEVYDVDILKNLFNCLYKK